MKPANLLQLELKTALGRPRSALLRLGLAFLIGSPLVMVELPANVRSTGLTMVVVFIAFFGAAVASARAVDRGEMAYLETLPLSRWLIAVDKILAGAFIDLLQILPLMALLLIISPLNIGLMVIINLAATVVVVIGLLNGLGHLVGRLLHNNAEIHLAGALLVGLLAFTAGLFPVPRLLAGLIGTISKFNPLAWLRMGLADCLSGSGGPDPAWPLIVPAALLVACFVLRAFNFSPGSVRIADK